MEEQETKLSYQQKIDYADKKVEEKLQEWGEKLGMNLKVVAIIAAFGIFLIILYLIRKAIVKV